MTKRKAVMTAFAVTEILLYIAFLVCDICGRFPDASTAFKYVSVLICFLVSLIGASEKDGRYIAVALAFTVCADLFLLVIGSFYTIGVTFFCPVQIIYALRIRHLRNRKPLFALRLFLSLAMLTVACIVEFSALNILISFYFPQLVCNSIESLGAKNRLFSIGLWLFVCCDICVGLSNISFPFSTPEAIVSTIQVLMWAFYLPSQVLIVLSSQRGS